MAVSKERQRRNRNAAIGAGAVGGGIIAANVGAAMHDVGTETRNIGRATARIQGRTFRGAQSAKRDYIHQAAEIGEQVKRRPATLGDRQRLKSLGDAWRSQNEFGQKARKGLKESHATIRQGVKLRRGGVGAIAGGAVAAGAGLAAIEHNKPKKVKKSVEFAKKDLGPVSGRGKSTQVADGEKTVNFKRKYVKGPYGHHPGKSLHAIAKKKDLTESQHRKRMAAGYSAGGALLAPGLVSSASFIAGRPAPTKVGRKLARLGTNPKTAIPLGAGSLAASTYAGHHRGKAKEKKAMEFGKKDDGYRKTKRNAGTAAGVAAGGAGLGVAGVSGARAANEGKYLRYGQRRIREQRNALRTDVHPANKPMYRQEIKNAAAELKNSRKAISGFNRTKKVGLAVGAVGGGAALANHLRPIDRKRHGQ